MRAPVATSSSTPTVRSNELVGQRPLVVDAPGRPHGGAQEVLAPRRDRSALRLQIQRCAANNNQYLYFYTFALDYIAHASVC